MALAEDKKNQPNYHHPAHDEMEEAWEIVEAVERGTLHLRAEGKQYLQPNFAETDAAYAYRLNSAILFNAFARTKNALVGMVFKRDVQLADDNPQPLIDQWESIDNAGTHGSVLAKEFFDKMMRDGHAAILVDMPPALGEGATLADERASNRRPYWVVYEADQIINWRTEVINGQTVLAMVVFEEESLEPDGVYGVEEVCRYRVFRRQDGVVSWQLYREVEDEHGKETLVLEQEGATNLTEIPVAIGYARKTGFMTSSPPLLDIALINLVHYNKYSDFSTLLHLTLPILCRKGFDPSIENLAIGPYTVIDTTTDGNVWYAEPSGNGLKPQAEDLKELEDRMSKLGLALLSSKAPAKNQTATETILDNLQEQSDLATAARSCQDALELALNFHAQYLGLEAGSVEMGSGASDLTLTPEKMKLLLEAVGANVLSVETVQEILMRAGELPEDFDAQVEAQRIEAKQANFGEQALKLFDRGQAPIQ